jgi:hypothetical protein
MCLNGSSDILAVWVFDPHNHEDGVTRGFVKNEADLQ